MHKVRAFLAAIEPWYDWGYWGGTSTKDERGGDGWRFEIEWLGFQIFIAFTRFPKEK